MHNEFPLEHIAMYGILGQRHQLVYLSRHKIRATGLLRHGFRLEHIASHEVYGMLGQRHILR